MQGIGDDESDVTVEPAVRRVPVRVVPRNLVGLQILEFVGDGLVDLGLELRQVGICLRTEWRGGLRGAAPPRDLGLRRRIERIFHEAVVDHHGEDVGRANLQMRREIEAERREAGLRDTEFGSVQINFRDLPRCFEFDENFLPVPPRRRSEGLPIPHAATPLELLAAMTGRGPMVEGIRVVASVRRRDDGPCVVIEVRRLRASGIGLREAPVGIEVEREPLFIRAAHHSQGPKSQGEKQHASPNCSVIHRVQVVNCDRHTAR